MRAALSARPALRVVRARAMEAPAAPAAGAPAAAPAPPTNAVFFRGTAYATEAEYDAAVAAGATAASAVKDVVIVPPPSLSGESADGRCWSVRGRLARPGWPPAVEATWEGCQASLGSGKRPH